MRKALVVLLGVCLLALFVGSVSARDIDRSGLHAVKAEAEGENPALIDQGLQTLMASAAVDTYCIIWFDFEPMSWQGWTSLDKTAQVDTFFHVDDFAGLDGGAFDRLFALEGSKSLWCGTRPGTDFYLCSWVNAPGYGNSWNQICHTGAIPFTGILTWSFSVVYDSEPDYDFTYIEYDSGDENWVEIDAYDGSDTLAASYQLLLTQAATKLRYHFVADGAWSDQDGLWDTDGAVIIDEITVTDAGGVIDYEDFESYAVGSKGTLGIWNCKTEDAFGAFSGLRNNLVDKDPCADNLGAQIVFFEGSSYPSSDYPGLFDTPFCTGPGGISAPCQDESVTSPIIDMRKYSSACDVNQDMDIPEGDLAQMGGAVMRFVTYRDLPSDNLVYYTWSVRSIDEDTNCPGQWKDRNYVYYGPDKDYIQNGQDISDLVSSAPVQMTVGVTDMCDVWYEGGNDCAAHTPSPWLDNVRLYRYKTVGPSWSFRDLELFQDTFPQELEFSPDPMEEICRADMANDVAPDAAADRIDPGDSAVVKCSAPLAGGLDTLSTGEARVYFHCNVHFLGLDGKPDLFGLQLEGSDGRYIGEEGDWTVLLCEPARNSSGTVVPEMYAIDLNDSLFTRGYMVEYYFKAYDLLGQSSTLPASAEEPDGNRWEFTCLPTLRVVPGVLYVDDFQGRGTFVGTPQTYYDPAFAAITPSGEAVPDRYDVNAPTSGVSNGVGAYISAAGPQAVFCQAYEKVIFDSGDINSYTITEGTLEHSDKSNDAQLLVDWMNNSGHKVGLLVMGEGIAADLSLSTSAIALELVATTCGVSLQNESYYELTGGRTAGGTITPLITGVSGGPYDGMSYYAFGGCPIINSFDVIQTTGPGEYALQYPDYLGDPYYVGIYTPDQTNGAGFPLRTVWVGHSFMSIRDAVQPAPPVRNAFLNATYLFFENGVSGDFTGTELPKAYSLAQNFPNPFNPSTRIQFALPTKGHVSLKIYNVAGQLVKTLQDGVMDAGSHELTWDGSNNLGANVASGVYFYKINAGDNYENMKKMVLLR
jgi:hypothetical protein